MKLLQTYFLQTQPWSVDEQTEQTRNRQTCRRVTVLDPPPGIDPAWKSVRRVIRVERQGHRAQQFTCQTVFYISSLELDAAGFAQRIRAHWHVENRLHWVKDTVLQEDKAPLCDGHALTNFAIVRTMAINLFRANGFASITKGIRHLAHDIHKLFSSCQ